MRLDRRNPALPASGAPEPRASPQLRQCGRFLAVGLINTGFGYLMFAGAHLGGLRPELALLVAAVAGIGFNFMTTGRLVFASRDPGLLPRFALVYAAAYGLNVLMLDALVALGVPPLYAQPMLLPIVVVFTFAAMRTLVFRGR